MTIKYRFERKIRKDGDNCWVWVGTVDNNEYGVFTIDKKKYLTHRFSLYLYKNFDLNSKNFVLHKCNNKLCVNPDHLYVGNHKDNMRDYSNSITHCIKGHEYTENNTYLYLGAKQCRICHRNREALRREQQPII